MTADADPSADDSPELESDEGEVPTLVDAVPRPVPRPAMRSARPRDDATVVDAAPRSAAPVVRVPVRAPQIRVPDDADFSARYQLGDVIGEGGMGEVRLCTDARIGRVVAIKVIRPESARRPRLRARFLFEAKMQGQLEHPSIVPVYDIGVRPDGSEFFTMKRVRGRTLQDVLRALRAGDRGTSVAFTRRRLLAALQSVCLAVEFAHQRGVVHRDLKPPNVMLGEFGEVSVLDWGLAKLRDRGVEPSGEGVGMGELESALGRASAGPAAQDTTGVGEVLGTPGYMSPEQCVSSQSVGPATDVFALGSMLFETLTLHHLVSGQTPAEVTRATIGGLYEARISKRYPDLDIAPELEVACVKATAADPAHRYERARDLADAIERYLEGDRDVARRRSMAGRHTRAAIAALAESVEAQRPEDAKAARSRAIRAVNNALAIDPQNQTALRTMMKILTAAPHAVAPEAEAAIRESDEQALRTAARRGSLAYLALTANLAAMGLLGVVSWGGLGAACACFLAAAGVTFLGSRRALPVPIEHLIVASIALSSCGIAASSMLFGALVYVPSLAAANVVVFAARVGRRFRWFALGSAFAAILVPLLLEHLGLVSPGWVFQNGAITIVPRVVQFPGVTTVVLLSLASLGTVLFPALLVGAERDARTKAERELLVRSHTLAELVPHEAKANETRTGSMPGVKPPG